MRGCWGKWFPKVTRELLFFGWSCNVWSTPYCKDYINIVIDLLVYNFLNLKEGILTNVLNYINILISEIFCSLYFIAIITSNDWFTITPNTYWRLYCISSSIKHTRRPACFTSGVAFNVIFKCIVSYLFQKKTS